MIVVDASAAVLALCDRGPDGTAARNHLHGGSLAAPELIYLEVTAALREFVASGRMSASRAASALSDLTDLSIEVAAHVNLLARCWELRANLTIYDAAYVALAEMLGCPLLTADRKLAVAPGLPCATIVF